MTTPDKATGLPIVGGDVNAKKVPIDPRLLPDLKKAEEDVEKSREIAKTIGYQLVLLIGSAATVGPQAVVNEKVYRDIVIKIAALHGVAIPAIEAINSEKGVIVLK